ncbi:MAG: MBL fold metallo-hydrolase [Oscillospiraceae bacterium]|nr:MBL fold metallo-hydrolase [Oscillospiraceae bacterium]
MDEKRFCLTVLGAGGSVPVDRREREIFGGDTSCYMVQAGDDCVFLDAGSGLVSAPSDLPKPPVILLSHLHLDHVIGLGMYTRLSQCGKITYLFLPADTTEEARQLLNSLYMPPWWPLRLERYAGELRTDCLQFPLQVGSIRVDGIPGNHPGGCFVFRLSCEGKVLVYATDYEHTAAGTASLQSFVQGADLLLYDAQYSREQYERKKGFGHSTAEEGIALKDSCGVKNLLLIHHDPHTTDADLLEREARIGRGDVLFARAGERIVI